MTRCNKCNTKIHGHLWLVDGNVYCSPKCERATWDAKARKWTTKNHRYGDGLVKKIGVAGLSKSKKGQRYED